MTSTDPALRATFRRPFPEQIAAYRLRLGNLVPTQAWDDILHDAHDRAFMVAGATKADLLADLSLAVDRAIADGTGIEAFRRDFRQIVERHGWHGWTGEGTRRGEAWRTRVIYQTNVRTSYAAGRMAQLRAAGFRYWIYRHGGSLEPRQHHLAIDGLILPSDHPFWDIWAPPNGWGCSCWITGAHTLRAAQRRGGKPDVELPDGWDHRLERTGAPEGIDKGWGYAPGGSVSDTLTLAAQKIASLPADLGTAYGRSLDAVIDRHWPLWVAETHEGLRHQPALAGVLSDDLTRALAGRGFAPVSSEIVVRPGVLRGPKADRHRRTGNDLAPEQWARLPSMLRNPRAVLFDEQNGSILFVIDRSEGVGQVVVRLDYTLKAGRLNQIANAIVSAYQVPIENLLSRLAGGLLQLLMGGLG